MAAASGIKIPNAQPPDLCHDMSAGAAPTEIPDEGPIVTSTPPNVLPSFNVSGGIKKSGWAIVGATGTISTPQSHSSASP